MKVRTIYSAQLRAATGVAQEEVELPEASTLAALIGRLAGARPELAGHLLGSTGDVQRSLLIIVNDAAVPTTAASSVELKPGDAITLLPPIAGG